MGSSTSSRPARGGIGGEVVRATILSANAAADVSLPQLDRVTAAMRVARLGDSDAGRVGQQVRVVGAPYGLSYAMSVGWISARWAPNTIFPDMPLAEFLQTTATITTGNSRGPLFDMSGEVIGIVSQNSGKELAVRGDVILSVDGIPVVSEDNIERIRNHLAAMPSGGAFTMSVLRAGKVIELTGTGE